MRRAPFIHKFLILINNFKIFRYELTKKSEKYEKTLKRQSENSENFYHNQKCMYKGRSSHKIMQNIFK